MPEIKIQVNIDELDCTGANRVKEVILKYIDNCKKLQFWDESISEIIITNDLNSEIKAISKKWNRKFSLSTSKETAVYSKTLFNQDLDNPDYIILIDFIAFYSEGLSAEEIIYSQSLNIKAKSIIPKEKLKIQFQSSITTFDEFVTILAIEWCKAWYTRTNMLGKFNNISSIDINIFSRQFKRSIKRHLFEYNSDAEDDNQALSSFWKNYFYDVESLITLLISNYTTEVDYNTLDFEDTTKNGIIGIIQEVKQITEKVIEKQKFETVDLSQKIVIFSETLNIRLVESQNDFKIHFFKDPKDYFKNNLIDTEPRIVCFLDILGFKELVYRYDNDLTSNVLQDFQSSFLEAKKNVFDNNSFLKEHIKHIEYQTFSDNICISVPYFENEKDFLFNLNVILTYVRSLQSILMIKGYYLRGGISTGSYFADENIIFSQGLIKSYYLESKRAIYPRVLIHEEIIERILKYNSIFNDFKYLGKMIILDWENNAFTNPFMISEIAIETINQNMKGILLDKDLPAGNSEQTTDNFVSFSELEIDEFSKSIKEAFEFSIATLKHASEMEKMKLGNIKEDVKEKLKENEKDKHIQTKFLWLYEFITWIQAAQESKIKFSFFLDYIETAKKTF